MHVNIGTRVSAITKAVNMFITKMTVNSTSMGKIAKTKVAKKGTEILVEIGIMKGVEEKKVVHTFTKRHMIQEKDIPVEAGAKDTKEAEAEVWRGI